LLLPLYIAIYIGTFLSIGIYLYESGNIQLRYLTLNENGRVTEHSLEDLSAEHPPIALINVEGTLYFAAVDDMENNLRAILQTGVKVMILRVRRLHHRHQCQGLRRDRVDMWCHGRGGRNPGVL